MMRNKINRSVWMFLSIVLFSIKAFGLKTDYETVKAYHNQEIEQLLKDYTLEDSLNIRVELKRKDVNLDDEKVVNIPGLYQKTGEAKDNNIEGVMNLYDRKVVLIKKREVSEEELDLVKTAMTDRLYLPEDVSFTMLNDIPKIDDAVKNMKQDFIFGAYSTLIKDGQFLWIIIFSIGFIVALFILAKVWKTKSGEGGASELTLSGSGLESMNSSPEKENDYGQNNGSGAGVDSSDFETFNFNSLCQNLNDAYDQAPGTSAYIIWTHLPDFKTQLQFYEILKIQKDIPQKSFEILDEVFDFKNRASHSKKSKGFNKNTLSAISVELAKLKFSEPHQKEEEALSTLYPHYADHQVKLYKEGAKDHYLVLYKIFKDDFMNYMSGLENSELVSKINDLLTFDPDTDHPSEEQYNQFLTFIKDSDIKNGESSEKSVNSKVVKMLYGLAEEELSNVKAMQESEELKKSIPRLSWVQSTDLKRLKSFILSLNGVELKAALEQNEELKQASETLDERTKFRIQETMTKAGDGKVNWTSLRDKIKKHYSYEETKDTGNKDEMAQAS